MKKFEAINKRNGKGFVVTINKDSNVAIIFDIDNKKEKEITMATIKRWFTLGKEIIEKKCEVCGGKMEQEVNHMGMIVCVPCDGMLNEELAMEKKFVQATLVEKKEAKKRPTAVKKDGTTRIDKFRPKLTEVEVKEIRAKFAAGAKKSHLAKEYNISSRTVTCIVEYIMWKNVG